MKTKNINRAISFILFILFIASAMVAGFVNIVPKITQASAQTQDIFGVHERTPEEQRDVDRNYYYWLLEEEISPIKVWVEEQKQQEAESKAAKLKKEAIDEAEAGLKIVRDNLPGLISTLKDLENGGDFDTAAYLNSYISMVSDVVALCGPYGQIASIAVDIGNTIFKAIMGGQPGMSETAQMEDRLNQQFDDVQKKLAGIESQINDLSNSINEVSNKIINAVTVAIDNATAKQAVSDFMISTGKYDFGYNQYRNYIYGDIDGNEMANTAYYAWLKNSIKKKEDQETIKYYYDKLYASIMDNWDQFFNIVEGDVLTKPIIQSYYDVVSARPELIAGENMSPKLSTLMFAQDIYQTALITKQVVSFCNLYQYTYMYKNGKYNETTKEIFPMELYYYDTFNGGAVNLEEVNGKLLDQIDTRIESLRTQLAKDVSYVMELKNSYTVQGINGRLYSVVNNDEETFGKVFAGQQIYLHNMPSYVCEYFDFNADDFSYNLSIANSVDGIFTVDNFSDNINASLMFKDEIIDSMNFVVNDNVKFFGGSGEKNDPYLIGTIEQFKSINKGMDKHYRLVKNIDFEGEEISPIGYNLLGNSSDDYYEDYKEFSGSLDGDGYTISNINIVGSDIVGLFGAIGEFGEVSNLKLHNFNVSSNIKTADKSSSVFYAGVVAGKNNGAIRYCEIDSDEEYIKETVESFKLVDLLLKDIPIILQQEIEKYINLGIDDIRFGGTLLIPGITEYLKHNGHYYYIEKTMNVPKCGVRVFINNSTPNRNIDLYVGGIAGLNNSIISCSTVENIYLLGSSTHSFGGNGTAKNKNSVYVGGVCGASNGAIGYSIVNDSVQMRAFVKSIYDPQTTVNPYVNAFIGGISAKAASLEYVSNLSSSAVKMDSVAVLDCRSNWGEYYSNWKEKVNTYIPNYEDEELSGVKAETNIKDILDKTSRIYNVTYDYSNNVYEAGSENFNSEGLIFYVNGVKKDYQIVEIYGFDANNKSFVDMPQEVVVLFSVDIEGETVYLVKEIPITIKANHIITTDIVNLKDAYKTGEFGVVGLQIKYTFAVGEPITIIITEKDSQNFTLLGDMINIGQGKDIALLYNYTLEIGNETLQLSNKIISFKINIICGHGDLVVDENLDLEKSFDSTCCKIGQRVYVCKECGQEKVVYLMKKEHVPPTDLSSLEGYVPATCESEGYTGVIKCVNEGCDTILEYGSNIPKLAHDYTKFDADKHYCQNEGCQDEEYHQYSISESVKDINENGVTKWYIVYTYHCEGCGYSYEYVDTNSVPAENDSLPSIVVSNGYALNGGDEVVVYVQLLNNPGIYGANFGIRFDKGLQLVDVKDGDMLVGSLISEGNPVNYGYNFVWSDGSCVAESGTLLKLVFKVENKATLGDKFNVSVVYGFEEKADGKKVDGGFSVEDSDVPAKFITKDGFIKLVKRLPGDINNDEVVDLLDAMEIAKYLVDPEYLIEEKFANIDLSFNNDASISNITIDDLVLILQSLTGGYGESLMLQEFEITLNVNGYETSLKDLFVSIYDENNNIYEKAGLTNLIRDGYKFKGWYDKMVGGNKIEITDFVKYNKNQKNQTLYAQWELNRFVFDIGECKYCEYKQLDTGCDFCKKQSMKPLAYGDIHGPETMFNQQYKISFNAQALKELGSGYIRFEFLGWKAFDQNGNVILDEVGNEIFYLAKDNKKFEQILSDLQSAHYGLVTLKAVWSDAPTVNYFDDWENAEGYYFDGWYTDSGYSLHSKITPNINDVDAFNSAIDGFGVFTVYAKYEPITYNLHFNFDVENGNNGIIFGIEEDSEGHSILSPYNFGSSVRIEKYGYTLMGWKDNYGNVYGSVTNPHPVIGLILGASHGDAITLTAIWGTTPYDLEYRYNYDNSCSSMTSDFEQSYCIENIDDTVSFLNIKHNDVKYRDYHIFLGWYEKDNPTTLITNESELHEFLRSKLDHVILYAKWDLADTKNYIAPDTTSSKIEGNNYSRIVVDWSDVPSGNCFAYSKGKLDIANIDVNASTEKDFMEVFFIGNKNTTYQNINIVLSATKNANVTIKVSFKNFNFVGSISQNLSEGEKVNKFILEVNEDNSISAPKSTIAVNAFKYFEITGQGNLEIRGGDGVDGENGKNTNIDGKNNYSGKNGGAGTSGTDGERAINCDKVALINCLGNIEFFGGNGGKGGDGGNVEGASNSSDQPKLPYGGAGGNGGNGGEPIDLSSLEIVSCRSLFLQYGNGGAGGKGGQGGNAYETTDVQPDNGGNGGAGGKGGYGFIAGKGGDGGNGGHSFGAQGDWWVKYRGTSGDGGKAGDGGDSISSINYQNSNTVNIIGQVGQAGEFGKAGTTDQANPGACAGYSGSNGSPGANGLIDNGYYSAFVEKFNN